MNFYDVLGINNNSSEIDIKNAYRALSLKLHPDRLGNQENNEAFHRICDAYRVLSDPEKRKLYDSNNNIPQTQLITPSTPQTPLLPKTSISVSSFSTDLSNVSDVDLSPIERVLKLTISESLKGGLFPLIIDRVIYFKNGLRKQEKVTIYVNIKAGIDDNEKVLIENEGHMFYDNTLNHNSRVLKGDIHVYVNVQNASEFQRIGLDLIYKKTIKLKECFGGFQFQLVLPSGKVCTINNKQGNIIKPNFQKVVSQLGVTRDNCCGNLIIMFEIEFPVYLSESNIESLLKIL
jgi:DnaJ-class molecular chaperone